jgi:hypothetical protein
VKPKEAPLSNEPKKPESNVKAEKSPGSTKKDRPLSNEELDEVSGGKGSAPVKLPFEVED